MPTNGVYLVARPFVQAKKLLQLLNSAAIKAAYLPLIEISYNAANCANALLAINSGDSVLFISPTAIEGFANYLPQIQAHIKLITVGLASKNCLSKYLAPREIIYPKNCSGIQALLAEVPLKQYTSLHIVGGEKLNALLLDYLRLHKVNYKFIDLYQRINCGLSQIIKLEKIFSSQAIAGIILTSQLIAQFLVECSAHSQLIAHKLKHIRLISLHQQISDYLQGQGLNNLIETSTADNYAILNLVRKLEHD